ncbi:uncharacterized protein LOC133444429 [Cololabis saira]|uniref:uncharacterized protein LOC133444429 n=1 Tax=Cololabis saira TaxID=129043 RepID=UPI002AD2BE8A|nr:uncharacterized protein LOC133444429 [Cololabis saira]
MLPLVTTTGQNRQYKPFQFGDLQALVDKLPPIHEGGGLWLSKFNQYTQGQTLALGDLRAALSRAVTPGDLRDIEMTAGTVTKQDDILLALHLNTLSGVLRAKYPLPNTMAMPKVTWDGKQNPREFLSKAKDMWVQQTGHHPGQAGTQEGWFRAAILAGIPQAVKTVMEDNPDMPGCNSQKWENHLVHHLTRAQEAGEKQQKEVEELQNLLLKMQVGEARRKVNEAKAKPKALIVSEVPHTPESCSPPPWAQQPPHYHSAYRGRGMGNRGPRGGRGGPIQRPVIASDQCSFCLERGHWSRECPLKAQRGRGRGQGPPRGQGGYCAPGPNPTNQMPLAWDEWEGQEGQE